MLKKLGFYRKKQFGTGTLAPATISSNITLESSSLYSVDDTINVDIETESIGANLVVYFDVHSAQFADGSNVETVTVPANGQVSVSKQLVSASDINANVDFTVSIRNSTINGAELDSHDLRFVPIANVDITASPSSLINVGNVDIYTFDSDGTNALTSYSMVTNFVSGDRLAFDYLVVAGGGAGGDYPTGVAGYRGGGGGAGGLTKGTQVLDADGTYNINVGRGGHANANDGGEAGYASQLGSLANPSGGGYGGGGTSGKVAGGGGASGGGGRGGLISPPQPVGFGGSSVLNEGNDGGSGYIQEAGGGGGGYLTGLNRFTYDPSSGGIGSVGGEGGTFNTSGSNVVYSAGGNGYPNTSYRPGSGNTSIGGGGHFSQDGDDGQVIVKTARYTRKIVLL